MTQRRQVLRLIGGPDAVTWPAFVIVYILSLVGHFSTAGSLVTPAWDRFVFVSIATVAMFVPLLILRATVLRDPQRPHPWIALLGFLIASLVRAVVISAMFMWFGHGDPPLWAYRIVSALTSSFVILVLVALAMASIHVHRPVLARLTSVRNELIAAEREAEGVVAERNEAAVARVRMALEAELGQLEMAEGDEAVRVLQRTASDVVRPLSHELAMSTPPAAALESGEAPTVPWQAVVTRMLSGASLRPLPTAVMGALLLLAVGITYLGVYTPIVLVVAFVVVWLTTWLANLILGWAQPRLPFVLRIAFLVAVLLVVAAISGAAIQAVIDVRMIGFAFSIGALFFMPIDAVLVAMYASIREQQAEAEREIEESTAALRRKVARTHQAQWYQQKALSRALHGPVQAAVVSAALRLDAAAQAGPVPVEVMGEIRAELLDVLDVLGTADESQLDFVESMGRLQGTWTGLCEVAVIDTSESNQALESDVILRSCVVDILTDSVSNAVRHGRATHVDIAVSLNAHGDLALRVIDDGSAEPAGTSSGLGTRLLDDCALEWERADSPYGHEVRAVLPTSR